MRTLTSLVFVCVICWPGFVTRATVAERPRHVVVISIDGLMPRTYLSAGWNAPTLRNLATRGAFAEGVVGVFPTVTYPSHTTLITGVPPAIHGIYTNRVVAPGRRSNGAWYWDSRDIQAVTLPAAAGTQHLRTAMINWPVSVGTAATVLLPDFAPSKERGLIAWRSIAIPATLIDQVDAAARRILTWPLSDSDRSEIATWTIRNDQADLVWLHLDELDGVQHDWGPDSEAAHRAVSRADREVAMILQSIVSAGLDTDTDIIVVSDHGCAPVRHELDPNAAFLQKRWLRRNDSGDIVDWTVYFQSSGGSGFVYLKDDDDTNLRDDVGRLLNDLRADPLTGINRVLDRRDLRALGADPRAAFAIEMVPGFTTGEGLADLVRPASLHGSHGYAPTDPAMYASLIMAGPDVSARGNLGLIRMTAIAPTLASWLHVGLSSRADQPLNTTTGFAVASAR
jgi:predicted AlkP superfamily pyrophosphatase or phosphodiesterase